MLAPYSQGWSQVVQDALRSWSTVLLQYIQLEELPHLVSEVQK